MRDQRLTEIIDEIDKAFAKSDWYSVKKLNSELADHEIENKYMVFKHLPEVILLTLHFFTPKALC